MRYIIIIIIVNIDTNFIIVDTIIIVIEKMEYQRFNIYELQF